MTTINRPQHRCSRRLFDLAAAICNRLIQQAERVAHASVGRTCEHRECSGFGINAFGSTNVLQAIGNQSWRHALQVELQATRQDRSRQFFWVRSGKQEFNVRWWLFERLEQRVKRALGQHVDLVDQVHLVTAARGRVLHVVEQVTCIVDLGFRRGINLDEVDETSLIDFLARAAPAAGLGCNACLTIERLGEYAGDRRLANAARSREQVGMMQPAGFQGIDQCPEHMLLANGVRKVFGPPFAGQDEITHKKDALR